MGSGSGLELGLGSGLGLGLGLGLGFGLDLAHRVAAAAYPRHVARVVGAGEPHLRAAEHVVVVQEEVGSVQPGGVRLVRVKVSG